MRFYLSILFLLMVAAQSSAALTNPPNATEKQFIGDTGFTNPGFESGITGWSRYADAAATSPVDCTGGSPDSSFTASASTSSPLKGSRSLLISKDANDRQGHGVSTTFDVNHTGLTVLTFRYEIASGTYADGDQQIWIYNVTDGAQQVQGYSIINVGTDFWHTAILPTLKGKTYRLCIHTSSTSASAYSVKLDEFKIGPPEKAYANPDSDTISFTGGGSWSANTTYSASYSRDGEYAWINYLVTTTGTPTSASLSVNLPSGLVIDAAKLKIGADTNGFIISSGNARDSGSLSVPLVARYDGSTTSVGVRYIRLSSSVGASDPTNTVGVSQAVPFTFGNGDTVQITFRVPIVGWSTGQTYSAMNVSNVPAYFHANRGGTNQTGVNPNSSAVKLTFPTVASDSVGGFDTTNSRYVAKIPGSYVFTAAAWIDGTNVLADSYQLRLYKNGNAFIYGDRTRVSTAGTTIAVSMTSPPIDLVAGDYVEINLHTPGDNSSNTLTISGATPNTYFGGYKLESPFNQLGVPDPWRVDVNISGANIDLGTSSQSSYIAASNSSLTLTNNNSGVPVGIACSSTNDNTAGATTCSSGNEQPGIVVNLPRDGFLKVCFDFAVDMSNSSNSTISGAFQVVRTANGSQTVAADGNRRVPFGLSTASGAGKTGYHLCGRFSVSAGKNTFRLMYEQSIANTPSANQILADANTNIGSRDVHVEAYYDDK